MMKRTVSLSRRNFIEHFLRAFLLTTVTMCVSISCYASRFTGFDPGQKGLGLMVGQPTTVRYESWIDWKDSIFFDLGYHTGEQVSLGVSLAFFAYDVKDYWQHSNTINTLLFYYGPGVFAGAVFDPAETSNRVRLGVKFFGGFQYMFGSGKYALRAEVGPAANAFGDRFIELMGGLGLTYYFDRNYKKDSVPVGPVESLGGTGTSMTAKPVKKENGDGAFDLSDDERAGALPTAKSGAGSPSPVTKPTAKTAVKPDANKPAANSALPKTKVNPLPKISPKPADDLQL